ncbi:hypothetical protein BKA66DRAFT_419113 [Pyrenochaeta sp. MPI-SDFR-AT-0127]|nr:hypothetical protein BKA66DRAFT_419113 [Pyrenochaeta sp. MPI-SDFR-AT-0127]
MDIDPGSGKRPAPRGTAAYPRKRAVAACQTCRSRKTKCDNRRPSCSFCERAGATCNYSTYDLSAYDPASLAILDRLDQLENIVVDNDHASQPIPNGHVNNDSIADIPPLPHTVEHVLAWPVFKGRFNDHTRLMQLLRSSPPLEQPTSVNFDLEVGTCKYLLEQCFEHILSKNPVLEEDSMRKIMNFVCLNGIGWDADSCLVLLVCALGSIASPDASQTDWVTARSYFGAAQRRMGMLVTWDGLIVPQCYFLAGVYFMYNLRPLQAWRMFAQAVVCIHPDSPETIPPAHYSLEECVYWSCWKSEVELRMIFQLPDFGVIGNRYPPHMPEPPITDASHAPKWYYYLADISLRRLDMSIRDTVATILARSTSTETQCADLALALPTLEEQLLDWARSMPDVFSIHDPEEQVLHLILNGRLLDSYDILYMTFLKSALAVEPMYDDATSILDAYARKALDCCVQRLPDKMDGYSVRHHGTWLGLRTCTRSALMLLAARLAGRLDLLPNGWQNSIKSAASALLLWKDESRDVADRYSIIRALSEEVGVDVMG